MFRSLQFTFPEGATFISYVDQKLSTLHEKMGSLFVDNFLSTQDIEIAPSGNVN